MNYILFRARMTTISRPFHYTTLSTTENTTPLSLTNLIAPKPSKFQISSNHLKLIQTCIQDLLQPTLSASASPNPKLNQNPNQFLDESQNLFSNMFAETPDRNVCWGTLFYQMHKEGVKAEDNTLSCALSFCGLERRLEFGVQLHCLGLKSGFGGYVYIGSCLISLYGKCGNLEEAYRVFEEMQIRNVVSWTALIAGFAQYWHVEMCLKLYCRMRSLSIKPNGFTITSIISACAGSGALRQGKCMHCQIVRMSFDSYVHISNTLITMYSKCGNVDEAFCIFQSMQSKTLVSWNSMIAGYAQHGLAKEAIGTVEEMEKLRIQPDAFTFLGVLSSCRHAGLVDKGRVIFDSMIRHGLEPDLDHYSCIVDLLGRAGLVKEAKHFVDNMPICPNAIIWGSLLSSCRLHGEVQIGIEAAENRLSLVPDCAATYMQLVNLYASAGCWGEAARVRKMMKDRGLKTNTGCSWIEIKDAVYRFKAEDKSNARLNEILGVVDSLVDNMRCYGYVPNIHEEGFDL